MGSRGWKETLVSVRRRRRAWWIISGERTRKGGRRGRLILSLFVPPLGSHGSSNGNHIWGVGGATASEEEVEGGKCWGGGGRGPSC